jgi:hypothetical protein
MKKITTLLLLLNISLATFAQSKNVEQIFETYQQMDGVISVNIAKPMFSLLNKIKINTDEKTINNLKPMLAGINSLKLLMVENGLLKEFAGELPLDKIPAGKLSPEKQLQLVNQINKAVADMNYMELITVNAKGRSLKFMTSRSDGNVIDNLLLSITSASEGSLLMFLDGKIAMADVNKFIASENE